MTVGSKIHMKSNSQNPLYVNTPEIKLVDASRSRATEDEISRSWASKDEASRSRATFINTFKFFLYPSAETALGSRSITTFLLSAILQQAKLKEAEDEASRSRATEDEASRLRTKLQEASSLKQERMKLQEAGRQKTKSQATEKAGRNLQERGGAKETRSSLCTEVDDSGR